MWDPSQRMAMEDSSHPSPDQWPVNNNNNSSWCLLILMLSSPAAAPPPSPSCRSCQLTWAWAPLWCSRPAPWWPAWCGGWWSNSSNSITSITRACRGPPATACTVGASPAATTAAWSTAAWALATWWTRDTTAETASTMASPAPATSPPCLVEPPLQTWHPPLVSTILMRNGPMVLTPSSPTWLVTPHTIIRMASKTDWVWASTSPMTVCWICPPSSCHRPVWAPLPCHQARQSTTPLSTTPTTLAPVSILSSPRSKDKRWSITASLGSLVFLRDSSQSQVVSRSTLKMTLLWPTPTTIESRSSTKREGSSFNSAKLGNATDNCCTQTELRWLKPAET